MDYGDTGADESWTKDVEGVTLPGWFSDLFPPHLPHTVLSFRSGKFHISHDDSVFDDVVEAYDYAWKFRDEYQTVFDSSIDGHGGELLESAFFCDITQGASAARLLLGVTTEDTEAQFKLWFCEWLTDISIEYHTNPDNFVAAHKWLERHPIFWVRKNNNAFSNWVITGGMRNVLVKVVWDEEEGETQIFLETGAHVAPDYTHCSIDYRLTSYGPTYEEAVIALAKRVDELYDVDGNSRSIENY